MRWVMTNNSLLFYSYNIPIIKIAIFHVYGRHFVFQNGRPYANFQKIPINYFGSHYKCLGHKYIVIQ